MASKLAKRIAVGGGIVVAVAAAPHVYDCIRLDVGAPIVILNTILRSGIPWRATELAA